MNLLQIVNTLNVYSGLITAFSVVVGGLWAVLKFRENIRDKRFQTYHDLIDQLVNEQRNPDRRIKRDRQIAIVFELRNYPTYYPVTVRILSALKTDWEEQKVVLKEIDHTIDFISKNWLTKIWIRFLKR